jgi:glycosyltransferase involved in cell wall biosynthesis
VTRESPPGSRADYAVVHLVAQESGKDLIGPQVVDHMAWQHAADGARRPSRVVVGFLEPARVAFRRSMRSRLLELRRRAPSVDVIALPYVSRLGMVRSASWIAWRIRRRVGDCRVVFHCRGESAAEWAMALRRCFAGAGLVVDVRGAWPEELLFARGFDGVDQADQAARRDYEEAVARVRRTAAAAGAVLSVSPGMLDWLRAIGVEAEKLAYVPCCVPSTTYDAQQRREARRALGLERALVITYLGTVTRYQHVEDGVVPFFLAMARQLEAAHLLCLTNDPVRMRSVLAGGGVPPDRSTVCRVPQEQIGAYLCASDAGLLLRAPSRINALSQPTKLGEYLAAGVPVIVSRGTGQVGDLVEGRGAGIQIDCFGVSQTQLEREAARCGEQLIARGESLRQGAIALCRRELYWSSYTEVVRGAYDRALRAADRL